MVDWKELSGSQGYKSLKATYVKAVQDAARQKRPMRRKEEFLKKFNWVINRARHYSSHLNIPISEVLNEWEEKRSYCWLNYYQDCKQPKFNSKCLKQVGIKGARKYYKNDSWTKNDPVKIKERMKIFMSRFYKSEKIKLRWSMKRKKRGY